MKTTYQLDSNHSQIHFSVRHMVISKVRGQFGQFTADLQLDEQDLTRSTVDVSIATPSIATGVADRDTHLRSADFLDVEHFPTMTFKSKAIEQKGDDRFLVRGDLTIRGVTQSVVLDTELNGRGKDPWGNNKIGFSARTSLDRKAFGLTWNMVLETGGLLVADRVDIEIEIEANAARATEKAAS
jgi:polyisoprenoid-binding protein YceI